MSYTDIWRNMDTNIFTNCLSLSRYRIREKRTISMVPNKVKNSDFMSILSGQPIVEFTPPKFAIGDKVRISKFDLPFRKGYKPQFTEEIFEIVALASRKPPTNTIKDNQKLLLRGKFYEKEMIRVNWS